MSDLILSLDYASGSLTAFFSDFQGELAALCAALIWAIASIIYTNVGRMLSPLMLNLVKGLIAIVLLVLTLILQGELLPQVSPSALSLLLLSGAIGIGLGDTAYFEALNRIGARRTLVLEALSPPLAALLALIFLQEYLLPAAWFGIGLTILGVIWVIVERTSNPTKTQVQPLQGVVFGVLAALGQASGAAMSRAALVGTDINPLWSTFIRLAAGVVVLLIGVLLQGKLHKQKSRRQQELKALKQPSLFWTVAGTALASTYLGIWLQQLSLKYAATGVAQSLSSTSPLFVTAIALWLGERVSLRAILGVLMALAGIWLLFNRG